MAALLQDQFPAVTRLVLAAETLDTEPHRIARSQINRRGLVAQADSWRRPRRYDVTGFQGHESTDVPQLADVEEPTARSGCSMCMGMGVGSRRYISPWRAALPSEPGYRHGGWE